MIRVNLTLGAALVMLVPALLAGTNRAQTAAPDGGTSLLQTAVVAGGPRGVTIELHASGPLPVPVAGTAQNPARIFLDFPGVRPAAPSLRVPGINDVRRVRIALNIAQPPVTRVVVELTREIPFTVDVTLRGAGRVTINVETSPEAAGSAMGTVREVPARSSGGSPGQTAAPQPPAADAATPAPPVSAPALAPTAPPVTPPAVTPVEPPAPPIPPTAASLPAAPAIAAPAPPDPGTASKPAVEGTPSSPSPATAPEPRRTSGTATAPASTTTPATTRAPRRPAGWTPLPAADVRKYQASASEPLRRLGLLRPLIVSIDTRSFIAAGALEEGSRELQAIRKQLASVQPPRSIRRVHDLLVRACDLAGQSIDIRLSGTAGAGAAEWNAASAAAGALMLIDRAKADLEAEGSK